MYEAITRLQCVNSLAPEKFEWNFRHVIFKQILVTNDWGISCEIALTWMSLDFTDDQSALVQVMAWCHKATSHYLSQCHHMMSLGYNELSHCVIWPPLSISEIDRGKYNTQHGAHTDSKVHEANKEPIWGQQDPGVPNVGPMNLSPCNVLWFQN